MFKIYVDYIGGRFEAWCYCEGKRVSLATHHDRIVCGRIATVASGWRSQDVEIVYTNEALTQGIKCMKTLILLFVLCLPSVARGQDPNLNHIIVEMQQETAREHVREYKEAKTDLEREAVENKFANVPLLPTETKARAAFIKNLSPQVRKLALAFDAKRKAERQKELAKMTPDERKAAIEADKHHYDDLVAAIRAVEDRLGVEHGGITDASPFRKPPMPH